MGSSKDITPPKSEKTSPIKQEQTNIHLYPNWATIQAYYGPGVPIQPSYLNSEVMAGNVSHPHAWTPPQPVMLPYVPYSPIYYPGVVCAHLAVPLVPTPLTTQLFCNPSDIIDQGLAKMLERMDGVDMQIVSNNAEVDGDGSVNGASQSVECGIDASSNGSGDYTGQSQGKIDSTGKLTTDNDVKVHTQASLVPEGDANLTSRSISGITVAPENVAGKPAETPNGKAETFTTCDASFEAWTQNQRRLKREKRKKANRESARRSRLRKQAKTEEVMERYETKKVENIALKSEINQLMEESEKLRVQNAALMEKLNGAEVPHTGEMALDEIGPDLTPRNCSVDRFMPNNLGSETKEANVRLLRIIKPR